MKPPRVRGLALVTAFLWAALAAIGLTLRPLGAQADPPLLILISLDGFRWDYFDKGVSPNLASLIARGVRADAMIPSFPADTFPNHYTIVTGLYPAHHGIIANAIRDPKTGRTFGISKSIEVGDSMWWGGEPVWVTARRAGLRTATMFWPGSEAAIGGIRPTYWKRYSKTVRGTARVDQVLRWLDLPPDGRPSFITIYFEDVDSAGHGSGPDADAVRQAIARVDEYVGRLLRGLERRTLTARANIVVVSDHGMAAALPGQVVTLSDYISLDDVDVVEVNPTLGLFPKSGRDDRVYRALSGASPRLKVYRADATPPLWHYRGHPRIPPIVGVVDEGWQLVRGTLSERAVQTVRPLRGMHGYDPSVASMRAIFVAAGPAFRSGSRVGAFENVHVYNVLAGALGVMPARNDGDPAVARMILK